MNKRLLLFLLVVFTVNSCTFDQKADSPQVVEQDEGDLIIVDDFPLVEKLKGTNVGPQGLINDPDAIISLQEYFLIHDQKGGKEYHLLDEKLNHISSFSKQDFVPGEKNGVTMLFRQSSVQGNKLYDYCYDREINIYQIVQKGEDIKVDYQESLAIPDQLYNMQSLAIIDSSRFVGLGGMPDGKLYFFNTKKEDIIITPFVPALDKKQAEGELMNSYNGIVTFEKSQNKIVTSSKRFNQFEVYSMEGKLLKQIRLGSLKTPFDSKRDRSIYYYDIYTDSNYIYALYLGKSSSDIMNKLMDRLKPELHIFNWNGQAIANLKLDRLVSAFTIEQNTKKLLCLDDTVEDQRIVAYDLPVFLE